MLVALKRLKVGLITKEAGDLCPELEGGRIRHLINTGSLKEVASAEEAARFKVKGKATAAADRFRTDWKKLSRHVGEDPGKAADGIIAQLLALHAPDDHPSKAELAVIRSALVHSEYARIEARQEIARLTEEAGKAASEEGKLALEVDALLADMAETFGPPPDEKKKLALRKRLIASEELRQTVRADLVAAKEAKAAGNEPKTTATPAPAPADPVVPAPAGAPSDPVPAPTGDAAKPADVETPAPKAKTREEKRAEAKAAKEAAKAKADAEKPADPPKRKR